MGLLGTQLLLVEEYLALGLAPEKIDRVSAAHSTGELSAQFFGLLKGKP